MLFLNKNGIFYRGRESKKLVKINNILNVLDETVKISKDFTVADFFNIINKDLPTFNSIFGSSAGGINLEEFIKEMNSNPDEEDVSDVKYIELSWICEILDYGKEENKKHNSAFDIYVDVSGVPTDDNEVANISISLSHLSSLKNLPIRLKNVISTSVYDIHMSNSSLFKSLKNFTLFEFFSAIISEISFYGNAENKNKIFKEIEEISKDILEKYGEENENESE